MSETVSDADFLLNTRGKGEDLGAWVVSAAYSRDGKAAAFALADGTLRVIPASDLAGDWARVEVHDGACLSMVPDVTSGFLSGGDDGLVARIGTDGTVEEFARLGTMKWVDHVAAHPDGLRAASVGSGNGAPRIAATRTSGAAMRRTPTVSPTPASGWPI